MTTEEPTQKVDALVRVALRRLHPNPSNPRRDMDDLDDLADSLKQQGQIQALAVMKHPEITGHFMILAGHRRVAAAERAEIPSLLCVVHKARDKAGALELALVENGQRQDLDPIQEAKAIEEMIRERGISQQEAGRRLGRSSMFVTRRLKLLTLPRMMQEQIASKRMTLGEAEQYIERQARKGFVSSALRIGQQGCGACWEEAIRADERGSSQQQAPAEIEPERHAKLVEAADTFAGIGVTGDGLAERVGITSGQLEAVCYKVKATGEHLKADRVLTAIRS